MSSINKTGKSIAAAFDLPSLSDVLAETETETETGDIVPAESSVESPEKIAADHSESADTIYKETLQTAKDITELALDMDPARAPRMFEVAAQYYKLALEAKNSKSDQSLKLAKLIIEERKLNHELGEKQSERADVVMVEDRNVLLRRLKEEANKAKQ